MFQRRFTLAILGLCMIAGASGCTQKAAPTATESAVQKDQAISRSIMDAINKDAALSDDASSFQVLTVRGEATVYGTVDNELERSHAERLATEAEGVRGVTSRIKLSREPFRTASR